MYVAENFSTIKGRTYKSVLLMESYRSAKGPRRRTLANLSGLPEDLVGLVRSYCQGETLGRVKTLQVEASCGFAGLAVVDHYWRKYGLEGVLKAVGEQWISRLKAMVWHRLFEPSSKRQLKRWARDSALGRFMHLPEGQLHENRLYEAMDALLGHWAGIEKGLYAKREQAPELLLYDLTSSYFEGHKVKRAAYGYSRDHRSDRAQIVLGLVKDEKGIPLSVQLLRGNRSDVKTVSQRIVSLKKRFGIKQGMYVGDGGTVSEMNLKFLRGQGLDYLVCVKRESILSLLEKAGKPLQLGLFDERGWMSFDYEGKRYVLCHSEQRAERDRNRRAARLVKGGEGLERLAARVKAGRLKDAQKISERATRIVVSTKSSPYFRFEAGEGRFHFEEKREKIEAQEALDGKYLLECSRTDVEPQCLRDNYQDLKFLEWAFREIKSFLEFRPVYHWKDRRVQAHLYLVFLAYWLERQIELDWRAQGVKQRVCSVLRDLNRIRLQQIQIEPLPMPVYRLTNWDQERKKLTDTLQLTDVIQRALPVAEVSP